MRLAMTRSTRGHGTTKAFRQADGLKPLATANPVSVMPVIRTSHLISSGCNVFTVVRNIHYRE